MSTAACSSSTSNCVQFFVRTISGFSLVLHANPNDTIRSIHDKIHSATGIPLSKQWLIYGGKQLLQLDHTLFHYNITNNSALYLVACIQSTPCSPQAWERVDGLLYIIGIMCEGKILICITPLLTKFLNMIPKDVNNASSYLDTFASLSAPEAMVKLYISPRYGHKILARHFIQHFLTSSKDVLQKHVYHELFAPIVLQFCKLLRKAVTNDDPLYIFCRTSLGSMLDDTSFIAVQDIWPFVDELATKLSQGLVSSMEESIGPSSTDVLLDRKI
ncbi:E3 ubiquitin protein ligase UPL5-like protein [Tanacetum coccineum]